MSFADLKKTGNKNFARLRENIEKEQKGNSFADERIWSPVLDKAGNGFAVIRFLPAPEKEEAPYVRLYTHGFKNEGGRWFIENCPTTIGEKCPVCDDNSAHWNSGIKSEQDIARARKRTLSIYSNILVVSHPGRPEDNGQLFLFRFGTKVFEKILTAIKPEFPDETPFNPFDFWEGANFSLKIRNVEGYRNYDRSSFETPSPLFSGDDAKLEELWKREYSLQELVAESKFKAYSEIKEKFLKFISASNAAASSSPRGGGNSGGWEDTVGVGGVHQQSNSAPPFKVDDDDDDLAMYANLLNS